MENIKSAVYSGNTLIISRVPDPKVVQSVNNTESAHLHNDSRNNFFQNQANKQRNNSFAATLQDALQQHKA